MSVIDYFRHNAQYWVNRINTEGKLSKSEVKLAIEFVTSAFKWECLSSADRVAKELQNKGYVAYIKNKKEIRIRATLDNLNLRTCSFEQVVAEIKGEAKSVLRKVIDRG